MPRNNQVSTVQAGDARIVDGVNSLGTYVVLAKREDRRVAMRLLNFKVAMRNTPHGDKHVVLYQAKVHLEMDGVRTDISSRTPGFFGQEPSHYVMHNNRATGVFRLPISYLPCSKEKVIEKASRSQVVDLFFNTFVKPTVDLGGQAEITKQALSQWIAGELTAEKYNFPFADGAAGRASPSLELEWVNYQY